MYYKHKNLESRVGMRAAARPRSAGWHCSQHGQQEPPGTCAASSRPRKFSEFLGRPGISKEQFW